MNIGTFDISKYNINITTTTNEVILTDERKWHILKRYPEVKPYINKINEILSNPDNVYLETKKENTLWLIKKYDQNVKITLKLQENIKIQLFRCK
jgi:di/tripeptidase